MSTNLKVFEGSRVRTKERLIARFYELASRKKDLEHQYKIVQKEIASSLESGQYGPWVLIVKQQKRASLSLENLENHLDRFTWLKIEPFIRETTFPVVTVTKIERGEK